MKEPPSGDWTLLSTEVTDKNGKIVYTIPSNKSLSLGVYPVKMIVRYENFQRQLSAFKAHKRLFYDLKSVLKASNCG